MTLVGQDLSMVSEGKVIRQKKNPGQTYSVSIFQRGISVTDDQT
jgi:hypothetical protein